MKRLHSEDINTPEYYDNHIWPLDGVHRFDSVRLKYLLQGVEAHRNMCDLGSGWFGAAQFMLTQMPDGPKVEIHALDYSRVAREKTLNDIGPLHSNFNYSIGNVEATPFASSYFDVTMAGELIEHLLHPEALAREMARITKPGGVMNLTTLDHACEQAQPREYPEHLWAFDPGDFKRLFSPYGKVEESQVGNYLGAHCRKTLGSVIDLDDFHDENFSGDLLVHMKVMQPNLKVTLFAIPALCSREFVRRWQACDWVDLVPHGLTHKTSRECQNWTRQQMLDCIDFTETMGFTSRGFKAPGWQISDGCYEALLERGYWVADQTYNNERRPPQLRTYLLDSSAKIHGHIGGTLDNELSCIADRIVAAPPPFQFIKDVV